MAKRWQHKKAFRIQSHVRAFARPAAFPASIVSNWKSWLPRAALIAAVTFWIYWPALQGDFIWDDIWYIPTNPLMHGVDGLWKYWFVPGSWREYYPLEETVQWTQWQLWGGDTLGYHLTNVILHIISALLVWRLFAKLGLSLAWLGGLIFAIHPAQVESVAWINELKNTLSLPPFLLAMCSWVDYDKHGRRLDYLLALGFFLVAMLCKISMAMFPVVILLYAWWRRGAIRWRDVWISVPFFLISLELGLMTIRMEKLYEAANHAQMLTLPLGGFLSRVALAALCLAFYFAKSFLPVGPMPVYPLWPVDPPSPWQLLPFPVLIAVLCWLWTKRHGWGRHVLLGLGFFLIILAPYPGILSLPTNEFG